MPQSWLQIAFERDLRDPVMPARIGSERLVVLRTADGPRAFPATCPHRGADLSRGASLFEHYLVCPFHGMRIALNGCSDDGFGITGRPTFTVGGLVFVGDGNGAAPMLERHMADLDHDHFLIPGFEMEIAVPAKWVIENAFDSAHFRPVHRVGNVPEIEATTGPGGELVGIGEFVLPASIWQPGTHGESRRTPYEARAFGPYFVISRLGGPKPYCVLTAATPKEATSCVVRLSLAVPAGPDGSAPDLEACRYLLKQSRAGLQQDSLIWENLIDDAPVRLTPRDGAVVAYQQYAKQFETTASG